MTARAEDVLQRHGEAARELLDTLDVLYQYANDLDRVTRHNRAELAVAVWLDARSTQEPATVCAWREDRGNRYAACLTASGVVVPHTPIPTMDQWRACPYCTLPLTLSPESPNEGAK